MTAAIVILILDAILGAILDAILDILVECNLVKKTRKRDCLMKQKPLLKLKVPEHSENKFVYTYFL